MPQERRAQATHDRRTHLSATVCRAGSAVRRSGELERAPVARRRRQDHQHVDAVISRIPPSRSILRWRPGRWSHTGAKPPVPCAFHLCFHVLCFLFLFFGDCSFTLSIGREGYLKSIPVDGAHLLVDGSPRASRTDFACGPRWFFQPGCCRQVPDKGMGGSGRTSDCS